MIREILDIGAGKWPVRGATRAIDRVKPPDTEIRRPDSLIEYQQAKAERLPYPDNFFKKVVSRWALGPRIFRMEAYAEVYRVLQPGGRVEVRLLWKDRRYKQRIIQRLEKAGINVYGEHKKLYRGLNKQFTEFIICGRKT
ncbi:MAG: class I SAM-dependent methyltransferase [Chloroflexi bacterium]|nr:class I SAM-dependent methyltransferase [Chloroflexota bacterium]